jgi:hypothetical protein
METTTNEMMLNVFSVEFKKNGILLVDKKYGTGGAYFVKAKDPEFTYNLGLGALLVDTVESFQRKFLNRKSLFDIIDFNIQDENYKHLLV